MIPPCAALAAMVVEYDHSNCLSNNYSAAKREDDLVNGRQYAWGH